MEIAELKPIIESMIFVAEEPISEIGISVALSEEGVEREHVKQCIEAIKVEWNDNQERGIHLVSVAGGYQFRTKEKCAQFLQRLSVPKPMKLSGPSLETLSIIAYRQPIVRSELESIRGVDSGGVIKTLLDRGLLKIVGRRDEAGQPLLYGTTKKFLEIFNLQSLKDLPSLKDIDSLLLEHRTHTSGTDPKVDKPANPDDELTERIDFSDEDETEIIRRRPLEENEEEEKKDMEALGELEDSLKGLRQLEKTMFPKPVPQIDLSAGGGENGTEAGSVEGAEFSGEPTFEGMEGIAANAIDITEPACEDAFAADDSVNE